MKPIDAGLMARVQALLDARAKLPRAQQDGARPRMQVEPGDNVTDLLVYDEIGWFGICAQDVVDTLADIKGDLNVRINSPGGDVFDGIAIYNALASHDGTVTVTVDGLAASAASVIAMAGDTIRMNTGTQMMIHDASGLCYGNAADMTEMGALLDRVSDTIASIYADRTGIDVTDWRARMRAETWYSAAEAVAATLADEMAPSRRRGEPEPEPGEDEPDGEPANQATPMVWSLAAFRFAGREAAPAPPVDTASGVHHTATTDAAWDSPAAVAAMPAEAATLKYCHAWRDADGDPGAKSTYKFPHHKTEGGPANLAACRNGLARLSGADIPDSDRAGVEAHLRAHLADGGDDAEDHTHVDVHDDTDPPTDPPPAEPPTADEPVTPDPDPHLVSAAVPDDWAAATAHLTTSPDDEWANLTEALT